MFNYANVYVAIFWKIISYAWFVRSFLSGRKITEIARGLPQMPPAAPARIFADSAVGYFFNTPV